MKSGPKHYGIYRATVACNIDSKQIGRIQVKVPDVDGVSHSTWAMPSVPLTGKRMGTFVVPQEGANVWVQFEAGDPDRPVWTGGWWADVAEVPASAKTGAHGDANIVLQSKLQHSIVISDLPGDPGGIILKSAAGASIIVNDTGIYIQNGQGASIVMKGNTVAVNGDALVVA